MSSFNLPKPEEAISERVAPLGSYRCGGRCDDEGFVKGSDRVPCPKCRVYNVAGTRDAKQFIQIFGNDARLVRARTALEAMQLYAKKNLDMIRFSAARRNHEYGKKSVCIEYEREGWKRCLSRPTEERALSMLAYRIETAMRVATKNWKVPEGKVAGVVKYQLDHYMKERNLVFTKKAPCTCGPALRALGQVSANCKAKEHT